jgi:hypothetical protein
MKERLRGWINQSVDEVAGENQTFTDDRRLNAYAVGTLRRGYLCISLHLTNACYYNVRARQAGQ